MITNYLNIPIESIEPIDYMSIPTLSICSFVKNEKDVIRNMLECAKSIEPNEIVIIDEYSTDGTREILEEYSRNIKEYNVKIIDGMLEQDYSKMRNLAISNATKDWILFIDADEILEESLCDVLKTRELLKFCELSTYDIVAFKRKNYIIEKTGDEIFIERSYPDYQNRLLKNNRIIKYVRRVHEMPTGFSKRLYSDYHIIHKKSKEKQKISEYKYNKIGQIIMNEIRVESIAGTFLFAEGLLSIIFSQDKRTISQIGRIGRMTIGAWLAFKF